MYREYGDGNDSFYEQDMKMYHLGELCKRFKIYRKNSSMASTLIRNELKNTYPFVECQFTEANNEFARNEDLPCRLISPFIIYIPKQKYYGFDRMSTV